MRRSERHGFDMSAVVFADGERPFLKTKQHTYNHLESRSLTIDLPV